MYKSVPTYNCESKEWTKTDFEDRESFVDFLKEVFKEPGKYEFDECSLEFNSQARKFNKDKFYCPFPPKSQDLS